MLLVKLVVHGTLPAEEQQQGDHDNKENDKRENHIKAAAFRLHQFQLAALNRVLILRLLIGTHEAIEPLFLLQGRQAIEINPVPIETFHRFTVIAIDIEHVRQDDRAIWKDRAAHGGGENLSPQGYFTGFAIG